MKIVVLDGYTLNPGDLDWTGIEKYGELVVHDRTDFAPEKVIETIGDAEIIFTHTAPAAMTQIDLLGIGRAALEQANTSMGLALSDDEVDYLESSFLALRRNSASSRPCSARSA